jgi:intermediate peptidase
VDLNGNVESTETKMTLFSRSIWKKISSHIPKYSNYRWNQSRKVHTSKWIDELPFSRPEELEAAATQFYNDSFDQVNHIIKVCTSSNGVDSARQGNDALDAFSNQLCQFTDVSEFLRNLHPDPHWVRAGDAVFNQLAELMHRLNSHQELYFAVKSTLQYHSKLSPLEKKNLEVFLHDFEQGGIHLLEQDRKSVIELQILVDQLTRDFFTHQHKPVAMDIPRGQLPWITTHMGNITPQVKKSKEVSSYQLETSKLRYLLHYSPEEDLRKVAYSCLYAPDPVQEENLSRLLHARQQLSKTLGFSDYASYRLKSHMLPSSTHVVSFLNRCAKDVTELQEQAQSELSQVRSRMDPIPQWNLPYWTNQVELQHRNSHRGNLPTLRTAIDVLRQIVFELYQVELNPVVGSSSWHPNVIKYQAFYKGSLLGTLYCDLLQGITQKLAGAAHFTLQGRRSAVSHLSPAELNAHTGPELRDTLLSREKQSHVQRPIVVISMNLPHDAVNGMPWSQVETLWHEWGHALHSLLSFTHLQNISGTRCAQDLSEVPSILMELILSHSKTQNMFSTIQPGVIPWAPSSVSQRWYDSFAQLFYATMDQVLHTSDSQRSPQTWVNLLRQSPDEIPILENHRDLCAVMKTLDWDPNWCPHLRLSHLATYGATYYAYLWSRAAASQIFESLLLPEKENWGPAGNQIWCELLGWGGGKDSWECVRGLLGPDKAEQIEILGDPKRNQLATGSLGII